MQIFRAFLFFLACLITLPASAALTTISLIDHTTAAAIGGVDVVAKELLADGSESTVASRRTDASGFVMFDLEGLDAGRRYILRAQPYGVWVSSEVVSSEGSFAFRVGKLKVKVVDGSTGGAYAEREVTLLERLSDGTLQWRSVHRTDAEGFVRLDPAGLGGRSYVIRAASLVDGRLKDSRVFAQAGAYEFRVGGNLVTLGLIDHVSNAYLPGVDVSVKEVLSDGSETPVITRATDGAGHVKIDLDGLDTGRRYIFKAQPFGTWVSSDVVTQPGGFGFRVGKLQVKVLDGNTLAPYAAREVTLLEKLANGTLQWVGTYRTDASGVVKLDPPKLGTSGYVLRAASNVDGRLKDSAVFDRAGAYDFLVGGKALTVGLIDHVSNERLAGVTVSVKEILADGSEAAVLSKETAANGTLALDLDGLGSGRRYVFRAQPYGTWVSSDVVSQPGWHAFRVGKLKVKVVDGSTGGAYAEREVTLLERLSDGTLQWRSVHRTDAEGFVRLDPAGLGGRSYVIRAASLVDGRLKDSRVFAQAGAYEFRVGGNLVTLGLIDHVSNAYLPGVDVSVKEVLSDGSETPVITRATDGAGHVKIDLDGLDTGRRYIFKAQPFGTWVSSDVVTQPGGFGFRVGKLQVKVLDGNTLAPYAAREVTLLEKLANGTLQWVGTYRTDASGVVKLDPPKLGTSGYVLRAASNVDGRLKDSAVFDRAGAYDFLVGGKALTVGLIDHVSNERLAGVTVSVKEILADGSEAAVLSKETAANGTLALDLDGLGSGRRYVFRAQPYGTWVSSDVVSQPGWHAFRVGTSPVRVSDAATGAALAGVRVAAYRQQPDGALVWTMQATTDQSGMVRFDLEGLTRGARYILIAMSPFGDGQNYFSSPILARGPQSFVIDRDVANAPDQTPPSVTILEPSVDSKVSSGGFSMRGKAWDDETVTSVTARLTLPSGRVVDRTASYNEAKSTWVLHTGSFVDESAGTVKVTISASDAGQNVSTADIEVALIRDVTAPKIVVSSHFDGAAVPTGGFMVQGVIEDDSIGSSLSATISGGGFAGTQQRSVEVHQQSGRWSVVLAPAETFSASLTVVLSAQDGAGNSASRTLTLVPDDTFARDWHVLMRTSFGPSQDAYRAIREIGLSAFIQQQLSAAPDGDVTGQGAGTTTNFATPMLQRAAYSSRQLAEVMAWFWDNHFNTYYYAHSNSDFERVENEAFRANALGNFRTLLGISSRSPAMLYTLDGRLSVKGDPNENYARELLELHTLGVSGGYSQRDVDEAARVFTGWTVKDGMFWFDATKHDVGAKSVFGLNVPAGGDLSDGEALLDHLAVSSATARNLCRKLVVLFVTDTPSSASIDRCAQAFLANAASPDQIAQVVWSILSSPEFVSPSVRGAKVKTPLEFVVGAVRQLSGTGAGDDLANEVLRQGMGIYMNPVPTGYSDSGSKWLSTSMLHSRVRFIDRLLNYMPSANQTQFSLAQDLADDGVLTSEGVVGRLLERLYGPSFRANQVQLALDVLTENGTYPFSPGASDSETRVRRLAKALASLPAYHFQ